MIKKPVHVVSMIFALTALVNALIASPGVFVFGIVSLIICRQEKLRYNTKPAAVISIISLVIGIVMMAVLYFLFNSGIIDLREIYDE